jgi:hypothetical protein
MPGYIHGYLMQPAWVAARLCRFTGCIPTALTSPHSTKRALSLSASLKIFCHSRQSTIHQYLPGFSHRKPPRRIAAFVACISPICPVLLLRGRARYPLSAVFPDRYISRYKRAHPPKLAHMAPKNNHNATLKPAHLQIPGS